MNDEPVIPREEELKSIQEYFVSTYWLELKNEILIELDNFKEFILDPSENGRDITVSMNKLLVEINEFVSVYKEKFKLEHMQKVLQRFIIDDNERKILYIV